MFKATPRRRTFFEGGLIKPLYNVKFSCNFDIKGELSKKKFTTMPNNIDV